MSTAKAARKRAGIEISDEDLAVLRPQYDAVLRILRDHKLGWDLEGLAGAVTLKVVAMTWQQVTEAAPELTVSRG
jgi:hypothetical protein